MASDFAQQNGKLTMATSKTAATLVVVVYREVSFERIDNHLLISRVVVVGQYDVSDLQIEYLLHRLTTRYIVDILRYLLVSSIATIVADALTC